MLSTITQNWNVLQLMNNNYSTVHSGLLLGNKKRTSGDTLHSAYYAPDDYQMHLLRQGKTDSKVYTLYYSIKC